MEIEKTNSLSIFLPLFFGGQIRVISLPVGYKTAQDGGLGIEGLWRQYKNAAFAGFSVFVVRRKKTWSCSVLCTAVTTRKTRKRGIYIHQIPFYGDKRSKAVKRRRKCISFVNGSRKHWTPSKYSVVCSMHRKEDFTRTYSFDQQCYQMKLVLCPFVDFIDRKLSKNIQLEIVVCIAVR